MTIQEVIKDPDYIGLPEGEKAKVVNFVLQKDEDFNRLPDIEQGRVREYFIKGLYQQPQTMGAKYAEMLPVDIPDPKLAGAQVLQASPQVSPFTQGVARTQLPEQIIGHAYGLGKGFFGIPQLMAGKEASQAAGEIAKEHPIVSGIGELGGTLLTLLPIGGLFTPLASRANINLLLKGKTTAARFIPRMIQSGATFGSYNLLKEASRQVLEGVFEPEKLAEETGKGAAWGAAIGTGGAIANPVKRVVASGVGAGALTVLDNLRKDGKLNPVDIAFSTALIAGFTALNAPRVTKSMRDRATADLTNAFYARMKQVHGIKDPEAKAVARGLADFAQQQADLSRGKTFTVGEMERATAEILKKGQMFYQQFGINQNITDIIKPDVVRKVSGSLMVQPPQPSVPQMPIQPVMPAMPQPAPLGLPATRTVPERIVKPNLPGPELEPIQVEPTAQEILKPTLPSPELEPTQVEPTAQEQAIIKARKHILDKIEKVKREYDRDIGKDSIRQLMKRTDLASVERFIPLNELKQDGLYPFDFAARGTGTPIDKIAQEAYALTGEGEVGILPRPPEGAYPDESLFQEFLRYGKDRKEAITYAQQEVKMRYEEELYQLQQELRSIDGQTARAAEQIQRTGNEAGKSQAYSSIRKGATEEYTEEEIRAAAAELTQEDIQDTQEAIAQGLEVPPLFRKAIEFISQQEAQKPTEEAPAQELPEKPAEIKPVAEIKAGDEVVVNGIEQPVKIQDIRTEKDLQGNAYTEYLTKDGWIDESRISRKLPPVTKPEPLIEAGVPKNVFGRSISEFEDKIVKKAKLRGWEDIPKSVETIAEQKALQDIADDLGYKKTDRRYSRPEEWLALEFGLKRHDTINALDKLNKLVASAAPTKQPTAEQALEDMRQARKAEAEVQTLPDERDMFQAKTEETPAKEPWEMTQKEYIGESAYLMTGAREHETFIRNALREGKPVPAEVLKDYPDLIKRETDPSKVQRIKDEIAIGEMALKSGKGATGRKLSNGELYAIRRSVDRDKQKIGLRETLPGFGDPMAMEKQKLEEARIRMAQIKQHEKSMQKQVVKTEEIELPPAPPIEQSTIDDAIVDEGKDFRWWEYFDPQTAEYEGDIPITRREAEIFLDAPTAISVPGKGRASTNFSIYRTKPRGIDTTGVEGYYIKRGSIEFSAGAGRPGLKAEEVNDLRCFYENIIKERRETEFGKQDKIQVAGREDRIQRQAGNTSRIRDKEEVTERAPYETKGIRGYGFDIQPFTPGTRESLSAYNEPTKKSVSIKEPVEPFFQQPADKSELQDIARLAKEKKLSHRQVNNLLKVYTGRKKLSDLTSDEALAFLDIINGIVEKRSGKPPTISRGKDIATADFFEKRKTIEKPGPIAYIFFEPWHVFKKLGIWDEVGKPLYEADSQARENTSAQFYKIRDWQRAVFKGLKRRERIEASRRIWQIADGTISAEELTKARPIEKEVAEKWRILAEEYADKLGLPVEQRQEHYVSHIIEDLFRDILKSKHPFPEELASVMQFIHTKEVFDPFLQKRLGFPIVKEDFFLSASRYIIAAEKKLAYDEALSKIEPYRNRTEGKSVLPGEVIDYIDIVVNSAFLRRPHPQDKIFKAGLEKVAEKLPPRKVKLSPEIAEKVGQSILEVPRTVGSKPATTIISKAKELSYMSLIAGNIRTMVVNFTQPISALAKLEGLPHQTISDMTYGYMKAIPRLLRPSYWEAFEKAGLLQDVEGILENPDVHIKYRLALKDMLFWNMKISEFMNRVSTAYAEARNKRRIGDIDELIEIRPDLKKQAEFISKNLSDTINFKYGSLYRPPWTLSPMGQMAYYLQSFTLKHAQLLYDMAKDLKVESLPKDFINDPGKTMKDLTTKQRGALVRYLVLLSLVSSSALAALGMKRKWELLEVSPSEAPVWRLFVALVTQDMGELARVSKSFIPLRGAARRVKRIVEEGPKGILGTGKTKKKEQWGEL